MQLQDQLIASLTEQIRIGAKIRRDSNISTTGTYALDAVEKNKNVSGSLAALIDRVNSDLVTERLRIDQLSSSGTSASDGELTDIRVAVNGTTYPSAGAAVRWQVQNYRDLSVGENQPSASYTNAWIDTSAKSEADYFIMPEVRDDLESASDVWSSSKVRHEIDVATKDVVVSSTQPSASDTKLWVNTDRAAEADSFTVPEIRDDLTVSDDTWSSSKIRNEIDAATKDVSVGTSAVSGAKVWVDTSPASEANFFTVPEVRDDLTNTEDTWSSSKIANAIAAATKDVYVGDVAANAVDSKVWVDTSSSDSFWVPQIDDEVVSAVDTFSSQKITALFTALRQELGLN